MGDRPVVFIASPYTRGDPSINAWFQCMVFDRLLSEGKVWPVAPLWSHFQHTVFPRPYQDWISYDQALLPRYDCCLRLSATHSGSGYFQEESSGADGEVEAFRGLNKPVFFTIEELYEWVDQRRAQS